MGQEILSGLETTYERGQETDFVRKEKECWQSRQQVQGSFLYSVLPSPPPLGNNVVVCSKATLILRHL